MKKIINGKLYDTDTAKCLGDWHNTWDSRSHTYVFEALYQKRTGECFLYGTGGPMSKYSRTVGDNEWSGSEKIIPLSLAKAREWAEEHLTADEYEAAFGLPDENGETVDLHVQLPAAIVAQLKRDAVEAGESLTAHVEKLLRRDIL